MAPKVAVTPPPVVVAPPTPPAKSGFQFPSFGGGSPKVTVISKSVAMNKVFLASISKLLKGDSTKIKSFQKATDGYRSGDLPSLPYIKTLEELFGADNLQSVVIPLISELPESDLADELEAAYKKYSIPPKKAGFTFPSFGSPAPKKVVEVPKAVAVTNSKVTSKAAIASKSAAVSKGVTSPKAITAPKEANGGFKFPSFGSPKVVEKPASVVIAAPPPPAKKAGFQFPSFGGPAISKEKAVPIIKIPTSIPSAKKAAIEVEIKSLVSGANDAKIFYKNIIKTLGKPEAIKVIGDIIKVLPNDVGLKVDAAVKANK